MSRGLHRAIRTVRDRWVDGEDAGRGKSALSRPERDAKLKHGSKPPLPLWVPCVHFGVDIEVIQIMLAFLVLHVLVLVQSYIALRV